MPTYIIKRTVRSYHTKGTYDFTHANKWLVEEAWTEDTGISNADISPDPWSWKVEVDGDFARAWGEEEEGWSVYIKVPESDTIRALELGMAKINEAMGVLPEKQIQHKARKIVRYK